MLSAQIARELGININTLREWVKQYKENQDEPFIGSGNLRTEAWNIRELEKRIRDLEKENTILKKRQPSLHRTKRYEIQIHLPS